MDALPLYEIPLLTSAGIALHDTHNTNPGESSSCRGTTGSARWPFGPASPAQAYLSMMLHAAHAMGYDVPDDVLVSAGQLFYRQGRLEEVHIAGVRPDEPDVTSPLRATPWSTPTPPRVQEGPDGNILLEPRDRSRAHLAALVMRDETAPHGLIVAFVWDLTETTAPSTCPPPPRIVLPKQPPVPTAFPANHGRLPNNPLIAAGMAAIWKGGTKARISWAGGKKLRWGSRCISIKVGQGAASSCPPASYGAQQSRSPPRMPSGASWKV